VSSNRTIHLKLELVKVEKGLLHEKHFFWICYLIYISTHEVIINISPKGKPNCRLIAGFE